MDRIVSKNFSDYYEQNIEMKKFPDGDNYIRIPEVSKYSGKEVAVYHRLYPEQDSSIVQAILMLNILKSASAHPVLVSPYLPYSRQDKTFKEGEPLSANIVVGLLRDAGAEKLITVDCHFLKKQGEFEFEGLKILNLSANKLLVEYTKQKLGEEELEVISPDMGANYLVADYGGHSMKKMRGEYASGESGETYRRIDELKMDFEVKGKNVLIIDDMISTGGTMIKAVENVRNAGAKRIFCAATHGFFLKNSYEKLTELADDVFTTDSIPNKAARVSIKQLLEGALE